MVFEYYKWTPWNLIPVVFHSTNTTDQEVRNFVIISWLILEPPSLDGVMFYIYMQPL